jgi:hypothetical protein
MIPTITFQFIVFQPNPRRGSLSYWVDGESTRRFMKIEDFIELINTNTPTASRDAYSACQTYSFYLYNPSDEKVIHLTPTASPNDLPPDHLNAVVHGTAPRITKSNRTIEEILSSYGFNTPSDSSMQNLKVTLSPQATEEDGLFARLRGMIRRRH